MTTVSVVVPCRNEAAHIGGVLDSILQNGYPQELMEILVIDGLSDDGTREIVDQYTRSHAHVRMLDNPGRYAPHAMNLGIRAATGDIIVRMDCHAVYPPDYISTLVRYSDCLIADNVGPSLETVPGDSTRKAMAISRVLSHRFGVGDSAFRIAAASSKEEFFATDTVPFGCFRKEVFERVGLFDEDLVRNQDNEFNERILAGGGRIYLIPNLRVRYFSRRNYRELWLMLFQYAYYGPMVDRKLNRRAPLRRYVPAMFVGTVSAALLVTPVWRWAGFVSAAAISAHCLLNLGSSLAEAARKEDLRLVPFLFWGFLVAHVAYGVGYWLGLWNEVVRKGRGGLRVAERLSR